jgi:hypothetical protein
MKSASNDEVQLGICCAANLLRMDMRKARSSKAPTRDPAHA